MTQALKLGGLLLAALLGGAVNAETPFTVRADESPSDSIVSIDVGAAPFMLEQIGPRQIDLVTPDKSRAFDLSAVLLSGASRRIAATRVVADDEMNRLRFTLACDCAYGFAITNGVLALTLRAPEPEATSREEPRVRGVSRYAPQKSPRPFPRPQVGLATASDTDTRRPALTSAAADDVLLARKHLLEQLSRAADQGLLEFVSDEAAAQAPPSPDVERPAEPLASAEPAPTPDQEPAEIVQAVPEPETTGEAGPLRPPGPRETPVRARTAIDKSFRADRAETLTPVAPCIDPDLLNLSHWPNAGDFVEQVAAHRQSLLDEFDQPNPATVQALAQLYLLNGFGVEAETLIQAYGEGVETRKLLAEIARVVDGRPLDAGGPIATTAPCHGEALLWRRIAALPRSTVQPEPEIWADMANAFAALPQSIKEIVAAPLLSSLVDGGEVEQATQLNLILSRAPMQNLPALDLAQARLLAAGGEAVAAEGLYQRLAQRDAPEARESLIRLLDSRLSRGAPVSAALADALSELAFTTRGQPLELIAKAAEIRARAAIDGPRVALNTVREAIERTPADADVLKDAGHAALEQLSAGAGADAAMAYVEAVLAYEPLVSSEADGDAARRRVAKELISLGLPNAALTFLTPAKERSGLAGRLLTAEALISLDLVEEGLAELGDDNSPPARELRAQALARGGDFAAAANADPSDTSLALSAGDWENAATGEDGARAELAKYMADPAEPVEANEAVSLSGARAAQDAARATRALIEEALSDG